MKSKVVTHKLYMLVQINAKYFPGIPGNDSRGLPGNPRNFLEKFRTGNGGEQKLL